MIPQLLNRIRGIGPIQFPILRQHGIPRLPELHRHHNPQLIAQIKEIIALDNSARPESHEINPRLSCIPQFSIGPGLAVSQHRLRNPVGPMQENRLAIDIKLPAPVRRILIAAHMPYRKPHRLRIAHLSTPLKRQRHPIQILRSLVHRPPQTRILKHQFQILFWPKRHRPTLACRQVHPLFNRHPRIRDRRLHRPGLCHRTVINHLDRNRLPRAFQIRHR